MGPSHQARGARYSSTFRRLIYLEYWLCFGAYIVAMILALLTLPLHLSLALRGVADSLFIVFFLIGGSLGLAGLLWAMSVTFSRTTTSSCSRFPIAFVLIGYVTFLVFIYWIVADQAADDRLRLADYWWIAVTLIGAIHISYLCRGALTCWLNCAEQDG